MHASVTIRLINIITVLPPTVIWHAREIVTKYAVAFGLTPFIRLLRLRVLKMDIFIQKKSSKEINSKGGSPGLVVKGRDS